MVQNINGKIDVQGFNRGDMVTVDVYLNGRFFPRKDDTSGFMQSFNLASIERSKNTANQPIILPEDQLMQVEIPK